MKSNFLKILKILVFKSERRHYCGVLYCNKHLLNECYNVYRSVLIFLKPFTLTALKSSVRIIPRWRPRRKDDQLIATQRAHTTKQHSEMSCRLMVLSRGSKTHNALLHTPYSVSSRSILCE